MRERDREVETNRERKCVRARVCVEGFFLVKEMES